MAEAEAVPCLMRSVSQPLFASREFKEGDPLRALTTSVSFGRFMTEPLDWERWSSFSHNRIQEDVRKHSRPGAVAEKKAFFEAYFNKFASKKKSAKPPKKENRPPNYSPQTNVSPVTKSNTRDNQSPTVATDENMSNRDVSSPSINLVISENRNVDDIILSSGQMEQEKTSTGNVSSPIVSSNRGLEQETSSNEEFYTPLTDLVFPEIGNVDEKASRNLVCSQVSNVEDVSSNKGVERELASKKDVCSEVGNVDDIISSGGQMEQEKALTQNVSNQSSHVDRNKNTQIKDKISGLTKTEVSSVKSLSRKAQIPEIHPKNQISKCNTRVPSVNGSKKNTQPLPLSENKRPKPLRDRSVNGNKTVALKSLSTNHSKALIASTKKSRSITVPSAVPSAFSFKSDERAAKRKQFFQKPGEKPRSITVPSTFSFKSDERAAKRKQFFQQLEEKPKLKEKARSDDKKLRWSTAVETKPSTSDIRGPSNKIQKVQPTRTCPQKLGTKPKNFIEINKQILSSSMAFLLRKKLHD